MDSNINKYSYQITINCFRTNIDVWSERR